MSRRIVVMGAGGRLGAALVREWRNAGEDVIGFARQQVDLASPEQIHAALEPLEFGVMVNCAAQTNVDRCEAHFEEAMQINAHAVRTLAEICSRKGARCIHVSTDYVFDGAKRTPYTEEDEVVPISRYGESKRAGELALLEVSDRHLVVRVSWVFGPDRPSFVDQMLKRAQTDEKVEAVSDKVAVPTYTLDASKLLRPFLFDVPAGGVLHVCNGGECTWQEYAQFAVDCALAAGMPLKARTVGPLRMADLKLFVAKRSPYSTMSTEKLTRLTGLRPRPWKEALREYVEKFVVPAG
ncbi:MAG: dTDP-4-dehydrorhamnose reductase [Chthoniobacteraceae bacterium]